MPKYPGKNRYIGAWGYVGLDILYAIPLIGFIFLLVHCFSSKNENRMHYARSYFVRFLLVAIIIAALVAAFYLLGGVEALNVHVEELEKIITDYSNMPRKSCPLMR